MARQKLAVVLDGRSLSVILPVGGDRPNAMRADGDDPGGLAAGERLQVRFGQLLEYEIIARAASGIAGTLFFAQDAEGGSQVPHDAGEIGNDLATLGIVGSHAAQPQAIFL